MKKLILGAAALVMAAAPLAASAQPSDHSRGGNDRGFTQQRGDFRGGDRSDGYRRGNGDGGAVAAGLFGFVFGSILTHAVEDQRVSYQQQCWWQNEPVQGPYGRVYYQQVQVCR